MGAIGPCQGAVRREGWGGWSRRRGWCGVMRGPFDRLRANGLGRRACGGEWGMRWGMETPRAAPLWIPAPVRRWRVCGPARAAGGGGPPSSALRTGFDSLRANGAGSARAVGKRGCDGGRRRPARERHVREALRQAQGERIRVARLRWGVGVGDARGVGGGGAPPGAPLDTGFRRYDDCGCAGQRGLLVAEGGGPVAAGRAIRESPLRCVRGVGNARGVVGGLPRLAHLWVSVFAGTTVAGVRSGEGCWCRAGGPALRDGRFANRPYDGVWRRRRCDGGWWWGCPAHAPLDSCLRRNDAGGGPPSTGSGRTDSRSAPMVGCCARGRGSCLRGSDGRGSGRRQGHADYKRGTKDGAALRTGPPRMNCLVGLGPFGGLWAFGCALFSSGSGPACRGHRVGRRGRTIAWVSAP